MEDVSLTDVTAVENFYLFYFIEAQMEKLESVMRRVKKFREIAKEIVNNACHAALLAKGFIVDESQVEQGKVFLAALKVDSKENFYREKERS